MLDFHYSDFWADPAKQVKPKAWKELSGEALETAVYLHTVDTLKALKNHKLVPTMVQVGNEITKGCCGRMVTSNRPKIWHIF